MLVEDDAPLLVAHDIVSVQAIAELIEIVLALRAFVALDREHRVANLVWIGRTRLVDADRQDPNRVIGPRALEIGLGARDGAVELGELLCFWRRVGSVVSDRVSAPNRGAGELQRRRGDGRRRSDPRNREAKLFRLPSENSLVVFVSEIGTDDVRSGGLNGEHDRCEVLALVWIA